MHSFRKIWWCPHDGKFAFAGKSHEEARKEEDTSDPDKSIELETLQKLFEFIKANKQRKRKQKTAK